MPTIRTITVSYSKKNLHVTPISLSTRGAGKNEEVQWKSSGSRISGYTIDFNYAEGTPYITWTKKNSVGGVVDSGPTNKSGAYPNPFRYTITVSLKAQGRHPARDIVIDPEVVFDDSTPPPDTTGSGMLQGGGSRSGGRGQSGGGGKKKVARRKTARKTGKKK